MPRPDPRRNGRSDDGASAWELAIYQKWIEGETQRDLAKRFDCSQAHVSNVCRDVAASLKPQHMEQIDAFRSQAISRIEVIIQREMNAWKESCGDIRETIETNGPDGRTVTTKRRPSAGNSVHHATVMRAIEFLVNLLGIEPPESHGDGSLSSIGKTRKQLVAEILRDQHNGENN